MEYKPYDDVMLFMGVLSVKGFPQTLRESLEKNFGPIKTISDPFPFSFTDYYVPEMGEGIERFFISFSNLVSPDSLADIKVITNEIEKEYEEDGGRKINLDPGTLSSHRIAIGQNLYAELTLMYKNHEYVSFPWTYSDYKSERVQNTLLEFRKEYLLMRKEVLKNKNKQN